MSPIERAVQVCGSQESLAKAAGVSAQAVSHWVKGARGVSPESAIKIERATRRKVTRRELCPTVFGEPPARRGAEASVTAAVEPAPAPRGA